MIHEITIESPHTLSVVMKERLKQTLPENSDISLSLRPSDEEVRSIDSTVLVAIVGTASTAIGALLGGLFKIIEKTKEQSIKITGKSGRTIEITGKPTQELLEQCVKVAKELDIERIEVK
jgi:hypothetical protein